MGAIVQHLLLRKIMLQRTLNETSVRFKLSLSQLERGKRPSLLVLGASNALIEDIEWR